MPGRASATDRRGVPLFGVLAALLVLAPPAAAAGPFAAEGFTLANGMQAVAIPDRRAPIVTHMVWYKAGSADERPGFTGTAHLLEHLMFKGTERTPAGRFQAVVARHGGSDNAFTGYDYTAYHQTVPREALEQVMQLEAERMTGLAFDDADLEAERQVVLEERRQRIDADPAAILGERLNALQFRHHPYGWPVIGHERDIEALTREAIEAFYRRHYAPGNAVLVVAGDIDAGELRPLAEAIYGAIPAVAPAPRSRPAEPPQTAPRRLVHEDPRAARAGLRLLYRAPGYVSGDRDMAHALDVLAEILSGGASGRLHRRLVVEARAAVGVGAWYGGEVRGPGRFGFWAEPVPGRTVAELEALLRAEIADLLAHGVSSDEVARAKARMAANLVYARDRAAVIARWYGAWLALGLAMDEIDAWPRRIAAVTAADIHAAARAVLVPQGETVGILLPQASDDGP